MSGPISRMMSVVTASMKCIQARGGVISVEPEVIDMRYTFACPDCGTEIVVDGGGQDFVLNEGCPVCATSVPAEAFTER